MVDLRNAASFFLLLDSERFAGLSGWSCSRFSVSYDSIEISGLSCVIMTCVSSKCLESEPFEDYGPPFYRLRQKFFCGDITLSFVKRLEACLLNFDTV